VKSTRSKSNEPHQEEHKTLSSKYEKGIQVHFPYLRDLSGYTSDHQHSDYPGATSDVKIFDASGALVLEGREFHSKMISFWKPVTRTTVAEFVAREAVISSPN
jgi:hypothetical protein